MAGRSRAARPGRSGRSRRGRRGRRRSAATSARASGCAQLSRLRRTSTPSRPRAPRRVAPSSRAPRPAGRSGAVTTATSVACRTVAAGDASRIGTRERPGAEEDGARRVRRPPGGRPGGHAGRALERRRPRRRASCAVGLGIVVAVDADRDQLVDRIRGSRCTACPAGGPARAGTRDPAARASGLDPPAPPILGHDPDLLTARHVRRVARDRQAALEVSVVARRADDLRVDQLEQAVLDLDHAGRDGPRRPAARQARRPARRASCAARSSSSPCSEPAEARRPARRACGGAGRRGGRLGGCSCAGVYGRVRAGSAGHANAARRRSGDAGRSVVGSVVSAVASSPVAASSAAPALRPRSLRRGGDRRQGRGTARRASCRPRSVSSAARWATGPAFSPAMAASSAALTPTWRTTGAAWVASSRSSPAAGDSHSRAGARGAASSWVQKLSSPSVALGGEPRPARRPAAGLGRVIGHEGSPLDARRNGCACYDRSTRSVMRTRRLALQRSESGSTSIDQAASRRFAAGAPTGSMRRGARR